MVVGMKGDPQIVQIISPGVPTLTAVQFETLLLLVAGHSQAEIAQRLRLSRPAISQRVLRMCRTLGVANERALIAHAVRTGLVD